MVAGRHGIVATSCSADTGFYADGVPSEVAVGEGDDAGYMGAFISMFAVSWCLVETASSSST